MCARRHRDDDRDGAHTAGRGHKAGEHALVGSGGVPGGQVESDGSVHAATFGARHNTNVRQSGDAVPDVLLFDRKSANAGCETTSNDDNAAIEVRLQIVVDRRPGQRSWRVE